MTVYDKCEFEFAFTINSHFKAMLSYANKQKSGSSLFRKTFNEIFGGYKFEKSFRKFQRRNQENVYESNKTRVTFKFFLSREILCIE